MNTDDVEHVAGGKTFFWHGRYHRDINQRDTLQTDLNVFEDFQPKLSEASRATDVLFLGNIQPELQREVREQCARRAVRRDGLDEPVDRHRARGAARTRSRLVDCLVLNDAELKQLTDEPNLIRAARKALDLGPRVVIAKQGEYGSALITRDGFFGLTAYPTTDDRRADRRRRHVRGRAHGLPRLARAATSTTRRCGARWPTAPRAPRSTSRASARSGCTTLERAEIDARVAELERISAF